MEHAGIHPDAERNAACKAVESIGSAPGTRVKIIVIPTNEELEIVGEMDRLVNWMIQSDH